MDVLKEVLRVLDEVLSLEGRSASFTRETPLLGAIPELDSMAVVTLITTLEEPLASPWTMTTSTAPLSLPWFAGGLCRRQNGSLMPQPLPPEVFFLAVGQPLPSGQGLCL